MNRKRGVGFCGLICPLCKDNESCIGCKKGGCPEKEHCKNYNCCIEKGYDSCYECKDYPCEDSILIKPRVKMFCDLISEYGEDKLLDALEINENSGIQYHYLGVHVGDYDQVDTKDDLIKMIFEHKINSK